MSNRRHISEKAKRILDPIVAFGAALAIALLIILGNHYLSRPRISMLPDGNTIHVDSRFGARVLTEDVQMRLESFMGKITTVEFDAPGGGTTGGARAIAEMLNKSHVMFSVPTNAKCASGCAAAYALTDLRKADESALFQVHGPGEGASLAPLYKDVHRGTNILKFFEGCKPQSPLEGSNFLWLSASDFNRVLTDPGFTCSQIRFVTP